MKGTKEHQQKYCHFLLRMLQGRRYKPEMQSTAEYKYKEEHFVSLNWESVVSLRIRKWMCQTI
jgi:hypothetical protein